VRSKHALFLASRLRRTPPREQLPPSIIAREGCRSLSRLRSPATAVNRAYRIRLGIAAVAGHAFHGAVIPRPAARGAAGGGCCAAPADGRVVAVERSRDPYLDREALRISVFMNVFNALESHSG